ncbi:MAG: metal ABC transporter substrate-binding protein [Rubritalea sp.]|jgi:zinc/manganese transport system substrate-binding protein|tara:strand:+ start:5820 stop:6695 length:876 start_codon:yes stop_codon:yes gene_type:complete
MKLFFLLLFGLTLSASAKIKIATLSPLLADLARQVGGDKVEVIDLIGIRGNPHSFNPTTNTLREASGSSLYLASGKNLEPYLPKLKSLIGSSATVLEIGENIRSLKISAKSSAYACCPNHSNGVMDPHWWQSIENWRKATSTLESQLTKLDPQNEVHYKARAKAYRTQLDKVNAWAKTQIATIPRSDRTLATAHAAFGYFCKDFGFQSIPLRGLNSEQSPSPKYLALAVGTLLEKNVKAIFPDESSNPKALQTISRTAGIKLGTKIYADSHQSIIGMFQHNVTVITKALKK